MSEISRDENAPKNAAPTPGSEDESAKGGLLGRVNQRFQDALQNSRGTSRPPAPAAEPRPEAPRQSEDLAARRSRPPRAQKMIIPEGVVISGNVASSSEAEIGGRIDGDVEVKGHLTLESTALVSGNVRAHSCRIEGLVEGRVECVEELDLGPTGRLNAAAASNKRVNVEGQVSGDISSAGLVRVASSAQVTGDISARSLVLEEGGTFNGTCSMQTPSQKEQ